LVDNETKRQEPLLFKRDTRHSRIVQNRELALVEKSSNSTEPYASGDL
jgi:hypothetical protein